MEYGYMCLMFANCTAVIANFGGFWIILNFNKVIYDRQYLSLPTFVHRPCDALWRTTATAINLHT